MLALGIVFSAVSFSRKKNKSENIMTIVTTATTDNNNNGCYSLVSTIKHFIYIIFICLNR